MSDPPLTNPDIAPVPASARTWTWWHYCALWIGMSVCIPTYTLASGLIDSGHDLVAGDAHHLPRQHDRARAHAAQRPRRHEVRHPVPGASRRASFGVLGANVPALLRALVACGWFGIQTWIGGAAIYQLTKALWPGVATLPAILPGWVGLGTGEFLAFVLFWLHQPALHLARHRVDQGASSRSRRRSSSPWGSRSWAGPTCAAGGFGPMLSQPSRFADDRGRSWPVFFPALTAMIGFWATLSLNIPDFTRYARSQRDQVARPGARACRRR